MSAAVQGASAHGSAPQSCKSQTLGNSPVGSLYNSHNFCTEQGQKQTFNLIIIECNVISE